MKATIVTTKEEQIVKTLVDVKMVTLTLSLEEASLLRTTAYSINMRAVDPKVKTLYQNIYDSMLYSGVHASRNDNAQDNFKSALGYPPKR